MQHIFSGKTVLITGATGGIGLATAKYFAQQGADIIAWGRSEEKLQKIQKEFSAEYPGRIFTQAAEVQHIETTKKVFEETVKMAGRIDVLVNGAGINNPLPFLEIQEKDWDSIIDINLKGSFFTAQLAAKHMIENGTAGRIINISSSLVSNVLPNRAPYLASKGGIALITKSLALELAPHRITVNAVAPAIVDTNMTQKMGSNVGVHPKMIMGSLIQPEEIGAAIGFLASDNAKNITGQTIFVDAGWSIH